jgi:hypothetical protein
MSIITNYYTQRNALIACDCLTKTGITNKYEFIKKTKQNDAYSKILVKKKLEKEHRKHAVNKWEQLVTDCVTKNETFRKCVVCNVLCIRKTEPAWKQKCINCYRNQPIGVCLLKIK